VPDFLEESTRIKDGLLMWIRYLTENRLWECQYGAAGGRIPFQQLVYEFQLGIR